MMAVRVTDQICTLKHPMSSFQAAVIPAPVLAVFRGIGQVFFQENALTGALFTLGIALSSPLMAAGALVGSALGTATAWALKFDRSEVLAGIFGFNSALVGIATLFFFKPSALTLALLAVGCIAAAPVTWLARRHLPFPTYTAPFIVVTWAIYFLGLAMRVSSVEPGGPPAATGFVAAAAHGIGQVMFQASIWTALLFLVGIALSDWQHALWVSVASVVGMLVGIYHHDSSDQVAALGLYGYNATLAAVALFLWRRTLIPPLLGILVSVPLTESFPLLGIPALTAPFVLATWIVLALGWLEMRLFGPPARSSP
jgi:urea transporter